MPSTVALRHRVLCGVFLLTATVGCATSEPSVLRAAAATPSATAGMEIAAPTPRVTLGTGTATISWDPDTSLSGYVFYFDREQPVDLAPDIREHQLTGLQPGTEHLVQLVAVQGLEFSRPGTTDFSMPWPSTASSKAAAGDGKGSGAGRDTQSLGSPKTSGTPSAKVTAPTQPGAASKEQSRDAGTHKVQVSLELGQSVGYDATEGEKEASACTTGGRDGFDDIGLGAPVTIQDGNGDVLATGSLSEATFSESSRNDSPVPPNSDPSSDWGPVDSWPKHVIVSGYCTYTSNIVVPDSDFYKFEVSHRGQSTKSRSQLAAAGWRVELSLSSSS